MNLIFYLIGGIALLAAVATWGACWITGDHRTRKNDLGTLKDSPDDFNAW